MFPIVLLVWLLLFSPFAEAQSAGTTSKSCGYKRICFYDKAGDLHHWALEIRKRSYGSKPAGTLIVTGGYPAIKVQQRDYNRWVDSLFAAHLFTRTVERYADDQFPVRWGPDFSRRPYMVPRFIAEDGILDIRTLKIPSFRAAQDELSLWDRWKADCGSKTDDGVCAVRADVIRHVERARAELEALIDSLEPLTWVWRETEQADWSSLFDTRVIEARRAQHLEPEQLDDAFRAKLRTAIDNMMNRIEEARLMQP